MKSLALLAASCVISGCMSTPSKEVSYDSSNTFNYANSFSYDSAETYESLYNISQKQLKTNIGYLYFINSLMKKHNFHWNEIVKTCHVPGTKTNLNFVVVVNANGDVINAEKSAEQDIAKCFESEIMAIKYPEPPFKNFYFPINVYSKT